MFKKTLIVSLMCALASIAVAQQEQTQAQQEPAVPESKIPVAPQPRPKSMEEVQVLQKIFVAQDPDERIAAATELLEKFKDTEFKPLALEFIALSYQQKNDLENMLAYGEQALQADPDNYRVMLMMAVAIAQTTREFDLDREEKLAQVERYVKRAFELLENAPRPNPNLTDSEWLMAKKDFYAQGYEALGLAELARGNTEKAIELLKKALQTAANQDPATVLKLGFALTRANKYDEAIQLMDSLINDPNTSPVVKQYAEQQKKQILQLKQKQGAQKQPASAPAPAP